MIIAEGKIFSPFCSGLHAVACYGWDKEKLLYQNSWGTGGAFGDGRGKIDFEKLEEIWGVIPMEEKKEFTDVRGHWAEKQIDEMAALGVIRGYEDGTFRPDKPIVMLFVPVEM